MKSIKDLKEMIKEPAGKEWFAKHSKSKALKGKKEVDYVSEIRNKYNHFQKALGSEQRIKG